MIQDLVTLWKALFHLPNKEEIAELRHLLLQIVRLLEKSGALDSATVLKDYLAMNDAAVIKFLKGGALWGGMGSLQDIALPADSSSWPEFNTLLTTLATAQLKVGVLNSRAREHLG